MFKSISVALICVIVIGAHLAKAEQMTLSTIMPKLEAIHTDAAALLLKNGELKTKILANLQAQNEERLKLFKTLKPGMKPPAVIGGEDKIDFTELQDFNKWVEANLEYAVKNTQASIEELKEEAAANNGQVDYTEQAIKDGIEGVKYWQQAVIFQDKTLKNEPFKEGSLSQ